MPILKPTTTANGAAAAFHIPKTLTVDLATGVAMVHLISYADEDAYTTGKPLLWNWHEEIPLASIGDAEGALIAQSSTPFFGGTVVADSATTLEGDRTRKNLEINAACQAEIFSGFDCDALGLMYHYPAKPQDQANLIGSVTNAIIHDGEPGWTTPFWCMDAADLWEYRAHSGAEIKAVGVCGAASIIAALQRNETLVRQIATATAEELPSITWASP